MAVSGSKNYSITRSDIVNAALRKIGEYDQGESPSGDETAAANLALNLLIKELTARGADLFLREEVTLFLQPNTQSYALGTAHATTSYSETTLSAAASSGDTTLTVTSTSGMQADDNIGIKVDDKTIHWTTVTTVLSSTSVLVKAALDDDAASGKKVYFYTTKAVRPQRILHAVRRDGSDIDTSVDIVGEMEYRDQSNKGSDGPPVLLWYHPTLTTGTLYVWPDNGSSDHDKLVFVSQVLSDDLDVSGNNPEFPIEWGNTLIWQLAAEMASEYGIPLAERQTLWTIAEGKLNELLNYDVEGASVQFVMGR